jgi:hypothetical protein
MRAQAEPHIARHPFMPDTLLVTFQEGRYAGPGAINCGYAVSHDGGLTWSRSLIPRLTPSSGGSYYRATDPVAGIDAQGNMFLNTLAALDDSFSSSALMISRSTNGGASFDPPIEIARSAAAGLLIDKNWMTINTFPGTPTFGRIVTTFTSFDQNGYPLALAYSDDRGLTWSQWHYITPTPFYGQGTQPVFLPDGKLAVVSWNFSSETIEVRVSNDGGQTFSFSNRVAQVTRYSAPNLRDGEFLPSAVGNRTNNSLYVVYQGLLAGSPRIVYTASTNAGVTWSTPIAISDNPPGTQVCNPAISASPDGERLSVLFYDGRMNPTNTLFVDAYLAYSADGGRTWQPNIRLTPNSMDVRSAPLTTSGYMLGDYQGIAPAEGEHVPAVGVFVDTRTGSSDSFIVRAAIAPAVTFPAWQAARFSLTEITSGILAAPAADLDDDGTINAAEYAFGMNPRLADQPKIRTSLAAGDFTVEMETLAAATDTAFVWATSADLLIWTPAAATAHTSMPSSNPQMLTLRDVFSGTSAGQFWRLDVQIGP